MKGLLAACLVLAAAGCASSGMSTAAAVDRSRETRPGGEFVVELSADGKVLGTASEIPLASVPAACIEGADRAAPGGVATSASKLVVGGKSYFMVVKAFRDRRVELMMNPDGTVAGKEDPLSPSEWPENVVAAARKAVPGGEIVAVEKVSGPEAMAGEAFHAKVRLDGELLRVSVSAKGDVVKVVRKMRAEVRVPR
ncbi:MAG: hypothetical protein HUU06_10760 [Planctomycetaceae bacterium]|nr:hypothetical protein [Planctomycetota bacterium]NUN53248.1 hypothetical protein [Planctomycetaceae bacterium]